MFTFQVFYHDYTKKICDFTLLLQLKTDGAIFRQLLKLHLAHVYI